MRLAVIDVGKTALRMRLDGRVVEVPGLDPFRPPGPAGTELGGRLKQAWEGHGTPPPTHAFIGSTARVNDEEYLQLREATRRFWPDATVAVADDTVLAHVTCVAGPGMVMVAGTGAAALGYHATLGWQRADGWGPGVGDRGSAYLIGIQILRRAYAHVDGVSHQPEMAALVEDYFGEPLAFPLAQRIARETNRSALIADLALPLFDIAHVPEAARILNQSAELLAQTIAAMGKRIDSDRVSLSGRLGQMPAYEALVAKHLAPHVSVVAPRYPPLQPPPDLLFSQPYSQVCRTWTPDRDR